MVHKAKNNSKFTRSSRRKLNRDNDTSYRPWENLPKDLLELILMQLSFIDYFTFGGVCQSWRSVAVDLRKMFMASQPPLLFFISVYAKRTCYLSNISGSKIYKTMLPNLVRMRCRGFSCGYLIMEDAAYCFRLINLITREELLFPAPPPDFKKTSTISAYRFALVYSTVVSNSVLVVTQRYSKLIYFIQAGGVEWTACSVDQESSVIMDIVFFSGKLYVLTDNAKVAILKLRPHPILQPLNVKSTCSLPREPQFVPSDKELLMMHRIDVKKIFKLDRVKMEWLGTSLQEESLFLDAIQRSVVSNPAKWGGRNNCICHVDRYLLAVLFNPAYNLNLNDRTIKSLLWFFPHQSNRNVLEEE